MENNKIKVLIIDDIKDFISVTREGLIEHFGFSNANIFPNVDEEGHFAHKIKTLAGRQKISKIISEIKEIIKKEKIDIIFLDLMLHNRECKDNNTGTEIINLFAESGESLLRNLPIVIISLNKKDEIEKGFPRELPLFHIHKTNDYNTNLFKKEIEENKIDQVWNLKIEEYRKIRKEKSYEDKLENIMCSIDSINMNVIDIKEEILILQVISKTIAKTLPDLTDSKNAKKIINEWENNDLFRDIMSEYLPNTKKNLFQKLYEGLDTLKNAAKKNFMEIIFELIKDFVYNEAEIEEDDKKLIITLKLLMCSVESVHNLIKK